MGCQIPQAIIRFGLAVQGQEEGHAEEEKQADGVGCVEDFVGDGHGYCKLLLRSEPLR